jgi:hypothetical protein
MLLLRQNWASKVSDPLSPPPLPLPRAYKSIYSIKSWPERKRGWDRQDGGRRGRKAGWGGGAGRGRKDIGINSAKWALSTLLPSILPSSLERGGKPKKNEFKSQIFQYRPITVPDICKSRESEEFYSVNKSVFAVYGVSENLSFFGTL